MRKEVDKQGGDGAAQGQQARQKRANDGLAAAFGGIALLTAILGVAILFFTCQVPAAWKSAQDVLRGQGPRSLIVKNACALKADS